MARMLGRNIHNRYLHGWCCPGHDGTWKSRVEVERSAQRHRERQQWEREVIMALSDEDYELLASRADDRAEEALFDAQEAENAGKYRLARSLKQEADQYARKAAQYRKQKTGQ